MIEHGVLACAVLAGLGIVFVMLRLQLSNLFKKEVRRQDDRIQKRVERTPTAPDMVAQLSLPLSVDAHQMQAGSPLGSDRR